MKTQFLSPAILLWCCAFALSLAASPEVQDRQGTRTDTSAGMKDDIQIHGAWTIVVRNSDGSVASRHQFQNALDPAGAVYLARLLTRQESKPTSMRLSFLSASGSAPCVDGSGGRFRCDMREAKETPPIADTVSVPTLTVSPFGNPGSELTLTGSIKTTFAGSIGEVLTDLRSPGGGFGSNLLCVFTRHVIATPIAVLADQTIDVTVVISFS
jgi:hypothetical protein